MNEVSFSLHKGEFAALCGPNGCGKTVLTKIITGLLSPDSGRILMDDEDYAHKPEHLLAHSGLVFQNPDHQLIEQTVFDDVGLGLKFRCEPIEIVKQKTAAILDSMDLSGLSDQRPYYLSGGQKKRVTLAGVMITSPSLIILDEPFTGLDWKSAVNLIRSLLDLHQKGTTILLVSHELDPVLAHITRILIMEKGRIVLDADADSAWLQLEDYHIRKPHSPNGTRSAVTWLR